jgi:hypothetical protein
MGRKVDSNRGQQAVFAACLLGCVYGAFLGYAYAQKVADAKALQASKDRRIQERFMGIEQMLFPIIAEREAAKNPDSDREVA